MMFDAFVNFIAFAAVEKFPALKNLHVKLNEWLQHLTDLKTSGEKIQETSPLVPGPVIKLKKMSRFELQEVRELFIFPEAISILFLEAVNKS